MGEPPEVVLDVAHEVERSPVRPDPPPGMVVIVLDDAAVVREGFQQVREHPQAVGVHLFEIGDRATRNAVDPDRGEPSVDLIRGQAQGPSDLVEGADIGVEGLAGLGEALQVLRVIPVRLGREVEAAAQLVDDVLLVRLVAVALQAEVPQPVPVEPPLDHLQRRRLLADEEDGLTPGEGLGDDVGDRLALARAGRAVEDQAGPPLRGLDGLVLAAVRVEDVERPAGWVAASSSRAFGSPAGAAIRTDGSPAIARQSSCAAILPRFLPRSSHMAIFWKPKMPRAALSRTSQRLWFRIAFRMPAK